MVFASVNDLVLYREIGSGLPVWPAIVCSDDVATSEVLKNRPHGYYTLVLLLGDRLKFKWALPSDMSDYDPIVAVTGEKSIENVDGLEKAYSIAEKARIRGYDQSYWKAEVRRGLGPIQYKSEHMSEGPNELESNPSDRGMIYNTRASPEDLGIKTGHMAEKSPTPSPSPVKQLKISRSVSKEIRTYPDDSELHLLSSKRTSFRPAMRNLPKFGEYIIDLTQLSDDEDDLLPLSQKGTTVSNSGSRKRISCEQDSVTYDLSPRITGVRSNDFCAQGTPKHEPLSSVADINDDELNASREFITVRVGPQNVTRNFSKATLWNRQYWRNPGAGLLYFDLTEDHLYELKHPALASIEPGDFKFVAEFLESGKFGIKCVDSPKQRQEACAELMTTWDIAEKLGMTDLLEHCVDKIQYLTPIDPWDCLYFACMIYDSDGIGTEARSEMKNFLSTQIAEQFFVYLEDDHLSRHFIEQFQKRPGLQYEVFEKRMKTLQKRQQDEDDQEDVDDDDDNDKGVYG